MLFCRDSTLDGRNKASLFAEKEPDAECGGWRPKTFLDQHGKFREPDDLTRRIEAIEERLEAHR